MTRTFRLAFKAVIILIAALAAVLIASIILWMIGADVGATFYTICIVPLTNTLHITEVLIRAIPLCIIALGITVAARIFEHARRQFVEINGYRVFPV